MRQWIAAYGDPRDPKVDPVDWVERIPLAETRNYVERIMENLQVYRARFGGGSKLLIEADLKRGALAALKPMAEGATSEFISAADGLRLHARCWGRRSASSMPVVCLPGLSRTAADFDALASALAGDKAQPRWVIALDYRGRGNSDYDRDPANYNLQVELGRPACGPHRARCVAGDFYRYLARRHIDMLLALARPTAIAAAVLNDIGPVIEPKGLMRIKGYVGKLPQPRNFDEGAEILRRLFDAQFPKLTAEDWLASARRAYKERNGALVPTYDVNLAKTMQGVNFEKPLPPLWREFDALGAVPLMVIRGANSDILSSANRRGHARARASRSTLLKCPTRATRRCWPKQTRSRASRLSPKSARDSKDRTCFDSDWISKFFEKLWRSNKGGCVSGSRSWQAIQPLSRTGMLMLPD